MPLVVPGLMSSGKDKSSDWQNKLMGKKIGDTTDEVVCHPALSSSWSRVAMLTLLEDLCKEGSTREAPRYQEWRYVHHGSRSRAVSRFYLMIRK
jgi:hypothetical protein